MGAPEMPVSFPGTALDKSPPLAGGDVWLAVMERAGWRCQCDQVHPKHRQCQAACDRPHAHKHDRRCHVEHTAWTRLITGPTRLGPAPGDRIDPANPDELIAWCPTCWDIEVAAARRAHRAETRARLGAHPTLF